MIYLTIGSIGVWIVFVLWFSKDWLNDSRSYSLLHSVTSWIPIGNPSSVKLQGNDTLGDDVKVREWV